MRLLPRLTPSTDTASSRHASSPKTFPAKRRAGKSTSGGNGFSRHTRSDGDAAEIAAESATAPVRAIDYTRPSTSTDLLLDLQRRVIDIEQQRTRKLTAGEFAIAVQALTGLSVEQLAKNGYVVSACSCNNLNCKGWNLTPLEHHRTAARPRTGKPVAVAPEELTDIATPKTEEPPPDLGAIFQQMFAEGLLKTNAKGATLIPPDGPLRWTHEQQLAFAQGFELTELLEFRGQPRELQRQLIQRLRAIGYKILSQFPKD